MQLCCMAAWFYSLYLRKLKVASELALLTN